MDRFFIYMFLLLSFNITKSFDLNAISENNTEIPSYFNLLYFDQNETSKNYKLILDELICNFTKPGHINSIEQCKNDLNNLTNDLLYRMFLASGYDGKEFQYNLADSNLCETLNKGSLNNEKLNNEMLDINLSILFFNKSNKIESYCVPNNCSNKNNSENIIVICDQVHQDKEKILLIILSTAFLVFFVIFIVINMFNCFFTGHNPYDENNNESDDENNLFTTDSPSYSNHENASRKGVILNIYYRYFSLSNLFYLLTTSKNKIYNDNKLKFVNGIMVFNCCIHLISCIFSVLNKISISYTINDYKMLPVIGYINYIGQYYLEVFITLISFTFTFKFLNFVKLNDIYKTQKLFILFFRQLDKIIIILFFNYIWKFIFDESVIKGSHTLWITGEYCREVKDCTYENFLPGLEFTSLFIRDITKLKQFLSCHNSNQYFIMVFWAFICLMIILNIILENKHKLKILLAIFLVFLIIRLTLLFLKLDLKDELRERYINYQFYLLIPNVILGILGGCIHYLNYNHEVIVNEANYEYFEGIDKIRFYLEGSSTRSICFIFSIFILFIFPVLLIYLNSDTDSTFSNLIDITKGVFISLGIVMMILTVKMKGEECWKVVEIFFIILKKLMNNENLLYLGRSIFIVNLIHRVITYVIIVNLEQIYINMDFFNIIIMYGIPLLIITIFISFVLTMMFELPFRIAFKRLFKIKKN